MKDRYIEILTSSKLSDAMGGEKTVYASAKKLWAQIKTMSAQRLLEYGQTVTSRGYEITIPYYLEIIVSEDDVIVHDSRRLHIHSVVDIDERRDNKTIIAFESKGRSGLWIDQLTDGGLELWDDADTPTNWDIEENGTGTISRESTIINVGTYAAKLNTPAGGGNTVSLSQDFAGVVGTRYILSFDVRTAETSGTRRIDIRSYDPIGTTGTLTEAYNVPTDSAWHSLEYSFVWGANDNEVRFSTSAAGAYYIDNVKLCKYS